MNVNDADGYDDEFGPTYRRTGNDQPTRKSQPNKSLPGSSKFGRRRNNSSQKGIHKRRVRKIQW
ncbi:MAG: hypothetical protein WBF93_04580 [Pirellulales bacterium]